MGLKRKQILLGRKAYFEQKLKDRLAFLSAKTIEGRAAKKDTIVRKLQADVKAVANRLRVIADIEKRTEETAKAKAAKAAAPKEEREGPKGKKPEKAPAEAKAKKPKADKKSAPPKPVEGEKIPPAES